MLLENENIRLRALEPEDLDVMYKWENDTETWAAGCTCTPYSRYQLKKFINSGKNIYETGQLRLMVVYKSENQTVGMVDLFDFDPLHSRAGTGIIIDSAYRNRGIARQVIKLLCEYAFSFLKLHQLYAYIPGKNEYSRKLMLGCGFEERGVIPDWLNTSDGYDNVLIVSLISHVWESLPMPCIYRRQIQP